MEAELTSAVAQQRAQVGELEGALVAQREKEATELRALEQALASLSKRRAMVDGQLDDDALEKRRLTQSLARLEPGLSRAQQRWARVLMPLTAAALVLLALLSVGVTRADSLALVALCGLGGFVIGRRRGRHG